MEQDYLYKKLNKVYVQNENSFIAIKKCLMNLKKQTNIMSCMDSLEIDYLIQEFEANDIEVKKFEYPDENIEEFKKSLRDVDFIIQERKLIKFDKELRKNSISNESLKKVLTKFEEEKKLKFERLEKVVIQSLVVLLSICGALFTWSFGTIDTVVKNSTEQEVAIRLSSKGEKEQEKLIEELNKGWWQYFESKIR